MQGSTLHRNVSDRVPLSCFDRNCNPSPWLISNSTFYVSGWKSIVKILQYGRKCNIHGKETQKPKNYDSVMSNKNNELELP